MSFKGRIIGLSATPYDNNGKVLQGFDLHINQYDQKYMIENGYLVPPLPYVLMNVELKGIRKTNGDYNLMDLSTRFNNIETVSQVVAVTKPYIIKGEQALVFCIDIQHSEAMAKAYNAAGISAAAMHSKLSPEEREQTMKAFKTGDIKLLTNPEILTTGFDHPRVDTIVLARSTQSQNLYKQMVGRGLRLSDGKESALVLDCAGVIENLGMPTDPIRPRQNKEITGSEIKCSNCESSRLYRIVRDDKSFWVCPECGTEKEISRPISSICENCKKAHGADAKFVSVKGCLYLECDCGAQTLISEPTSTEDLEPIFNDRLIGMIQNRVVKQYISLLIDKKGAAFITTQPVRDQIDKLLRFIKKNPTKINNLNPHSLREDEWMIMRTEWELADTTYQRNSKKFLLSSTLNEAVFYINKILIMRNKPPIPYIEAHIFKQQTGEAFDSETEVVKHIKNIYKHGKQSITDVVLYILRTKREHKKQILERHINED